jgi:hypothetical protein
MFTLATFFIVYGLAAGISLVLLSALDTIILLPRINLGDVITNAIATACGAFSLMSAMYIHQMGF